MPRRAPRPCSRCAVRIAVRNGKCEGCASKHEAQRKADWDAYRETPLRHLYTSPRWRAARRMFLSRNPFCVDCEAVGRFVAADTVDHDPAHRGDETLFWDESTWRARCKTHHDQKTGREMAEVTASRRRK